MDSTGGHAYIATSTTLVHSEDEKGAWHHPTNHQVVGESPAYDAREQESLHQSASDLNLPSATASPTISPDSDGGFKRAYSDGTIARASSEARRSPPPTPPAGKRHASGHRHSQSASRNGSAPWPVSPKGKRLRQAGSALSPADSTPSGTTAVIPAQVTPPSPSNAVPAPRAGFRHSQRLKKNAPKVPVAQDTVSRAPTAEDLADVPTEAPSATEGCIGPISSVEAPSPLGKSYTSGAIKAFAPLRRNASWIIGSRSPSPGTRIKGSGENGSSQSAEPSNLSGSSTPPIVSTAPHRAISVAAKARRPLSTLLTRRKSTKGDESPMTPNSASSSADRLPLYNETPVPTVPSPASKERFQSAGMGQSLRKRDELGSLFRSLEGDFQKFMSKPATLKANVVRSALLPFLRNYANHSSWQRLRPEDLDRRINVLNKWWTNLLELLSGKTGQSVSASDRPTFLDAITAIMSRPEWRAPEVAIASFSNRSRVTVRSESSTSVDSSVSDFLADSVTANVRNTFVQNLSAQMTYVVEHMAARNTPASVVTFCGGAIAYAFFYCPGVAEALVRLWEIPSDTFRRVLDEHGISRNENIRDAAQKVAPLFPSHLRPLLFSSVPQLVRYLRTQIPLMIDSYVDWDGPWKSRWLGKETDLFFCFVKQYHILISNTLSEHSSDAERIAAPGALLVEAQLLAVMDNSVRGVAHESHPEPFDGPLPITFDDVLGPDASAEPFSARFPNSNRIIGENRLIMLLRDFLSNAPTISESARQSFAVIFNALLKATAKRISLYDHNACFCLCDFLEESILILSRYYGNTQDPSAFLDWSFWFKVLRQMGESQNSTTDVRLYAFLYSLWSYIARDPERKRKLCLDWLLQEEYATRQICHWCPMVRAYFMRLLCWRIVQFDGNTSEENIQIYKQAHTRLRDVWHIFLYYQHRAQSMARSRGGMSPDIRFLSTAPSNPVPQRRFLIVRNESMPTPATGFLSFDSMAAATSSSREHFADRSLEALKTMSVQDLDEGATGGKKRWSGLKGLVPFASSAPSEAAAKEPKGEPHDEFLDSEEVSHRRYRNKKSSQNHQSPSKSAGPPPSASGPPEQSLPRPTSPGSERQGFKFSLTPLSRPTLPPARKLFPPNLPPPAQKCLQTAYPRPPPTEPHPPPRGLEPNAKYAGRALAEWAVLVDEARGFIERRLAEGTADPAAIEVPMLGIETFRRPAA